MRPFPHRLWFSLVVALSLVFLGCGKRSEASRKDSLGERPKIRFQTDWFPQAEHGGFYQALARGFYREAGLDVEILPGGPGAHLKPKILAGDADLAMNPASDLLIAAGKGLPLLMVAPFLQHDYQTLLVHAKSPVHDFTDLAGKTVTASPSLAWIPYLKKRYKIDFSVQPLPYGLAPFFADPEAIRQGILTNEPYLAILEGVAVRTLPLAQAGYDGYQVIFCSRAYAAQHPDRVRAFVVASLRGWRDFIEGDPEPAFRLILKRNRQMTRGLLAYSRGELIVRRLVSGDPEKGEFLGAFSLSRIAEQEAMLRDLGLVETPLLIRSVATSDFLPSPGS